MVGIIATPNTAWTTGQRVIMADGNPTSWSGTSWVGGPAPLEAPNDEQAEQAEQAEPVKRRPGRPRKVKPDQEA